MIKLALLLSLAAGTAFYAGGRTTYSGTQTQLFPGSALKVTPDPSNIWSFHETISPRQTTTTTIPVLVDFDNNGKMDTELTFARVLITDLQIASERDMNDVWLVQLVDDKGVRWDFSPIRSSLARSVSIHLTTPLAIPINSGLKVVIKNGNSMTCSINLIGRLVTM